MRNIIKSQLYQHTRDIFIIVALLGFGVLYTLIVRGGMAAYDEINGGKAFVTVCEWFPLIIFYMTTLLCPRICGRDFHDRTINQELLSGHKRSESYLGRVCICFLFILMLDVLMLGIPVLAGCLAGGWGPNLSIQAALFRALLTVLIHLRFVAEIICATFLLKNAYVTMLIFWIFPSVVSIPLMLTPDKHFYFISSLMSLLQVAEFSNARGGFVNGKDITLYITDLEPGFFVPTIIASVVIALLCIAAGYLRFQKCDMK